MADQPEHVSQNGLDFTCRWEGERFRVYLDIGGKATIGIGHLVKLGEDFSAGTTHEQNLQILASDMAVAEGAIHGHVAVDLSQEQFDALASFVFNCGVTAFATSTLLGKLNAGDYKGAADQLLQWCHVGGQVSSGLLARRTAERKLFLSSEDTSPDTPRAV